MRPLTVSALLCLLSAIGNGFAIDEKEPTCLSRFDFDYKVLSKLVELDGAITNVHKELETHSEGDSVDRVKRLEATVARQQTLIERMTQATKGVFFLVHLQF